jgi:hypothetical protein
MTIGKEIFDNILSVVEHVKLLWAIYDSFLKWKNLRGFVFAITSETKK